MKSGRLQKAGPTKTRGVEFVGWKLVGAAYVEERSPAALGIKKPHLQKPTAWSLGEWELGGCAYIEERPASESRPYKNQRRGVWVSGVYARGHEEFPPGGD